MPSHPASGVPRVDEGAANSRWVGPRNMQDKTDQGAENDAMTASIPSGIEHLCLISHMHKKEPTQRHLSSLEASSHWHSSMCHYITQVLNRNRFDRCLQVGDGFPRGIVTTSGHESPTTQGAPYHEPKSCAPFWRKARSDKVRETNTPPGGAAP